MKREFYFLSKDEKTQIHAIEWVPTGKVKAVLQMCHGMVEYIDRYHDFAEYLSQNGYYVVGHDHLGHGKSVYSSDRLGFFHETNGNEYVIGDIHQIRIRTEESKSFPKQNGDPANNGASPKATLPSSHFNSYLNSRSSALTRDTFSAFNLKCNFATLNLAHMYWSYSVPPDKEANLR